MIAPFPADIDREAFGHWLSGFVDGEGHFGFCFSAARPRLPKGNWHAYIVIVLRADDHAVLKLIQSYWQCGTISDKKKPSNNLKNAKPQYRYYIDSIIHHTNIIVPHFERFPLRAKKQRDFLIWREAVAILRVIKRRRPIYLPGTRYRVPRLKEIEHEQLTALLDRLKTTRSYDGEPKEVSSRFIAHADDQPLFNFIDDDDVA
jgi:hypothetical protein